MDATIIAGLMAAGATITIGLTGDIEGAADAIGDAVCWALCIDQSGQDAADIAAYRAIDRDGTEWDQVDSGWWE